MNITKQQVTEYYSKLTDSEKFNAFFEMVEYLSDDDLHIDEDGRIYWSNCGDNLGRVE